ADNDPGRFWAHVVAALARAQPGEDLSRGLIDALARCARRTILVLDDVHEIQHPAALARLDLVVRHAPPAVHLALSGRRPPELQLARLRVAGELADIGAAELCCRRSELPEYLRLFGLSLAATDRDELLNRSEGWMAGLRLMALRMREEPLGSLRVNDI